MDVHDKLDEIIAAVESARALPMSASCVVNRAEVLGLLEELRELLPEEFRHAQLLLQDREAVVEEGRREAERLVDLAHAERARLVAESSVVAEALHYAEQVRAAVDQEATALRAQVDDYVDAKLANFEVVLDKTLAAVQRGREKLRGPQPHDESSDRDDGRADTDHPLDGQTPPAWTF